MTILLIFGLFSRPLYVLLLFSLLLSRLLIIIFSRSVPICWEIEVVKDFVKLFFYEFIHGLGVEYVLLWGSAVARNVLNLVLLSLTSQQLVGLVICEVDLDLVGVYNFHLADEVFVIVSGMVNDQSLLQFDTNLFSLQLFVHIELRILN